jgi:hypothetical protein
MAERLLPVHAIFLGEVSDQQLDQLYRSCTAQLIVHPATSGALTRICDAAIAGIPIVGNSMARKGGGYFSAEVSQDEVICAREKSVIKLFSCLNQG